MNRSPTIPAATRIRKQTPSLNNNHIKTHHTAAQAHNEKKHKTVGNTR
jgi:hypothetical protein